jgi:cobalt-zinc-cadmium efflux system membrane fusion protein
MKYLTASFIIIVFGCSLPKEKKPAAGEAMVKTDGVVTLTDAQIKNAGIQTDYPVKQQVESVLKVSGVVDVPPQNIVSVSFPMGGYLKTTSLLPGMHVSRGEVIGIMEDQGLVQLQQDFLMAVARLAYLQQEFDRQKALASEKVNAEKTFQQVQSEYTAQKILVKGYVEKLRLIGINPSRLNDSSISRSVPIYSPINGFVSRVNVNIGRFVNPTDVLFELINPDDMHAALTVFEKDIAKVRQGQKVRLSFVDNPNAVYDCEVILVSRNVDENSSSRVHCHFNKQPSRLLPGMFLNAVIITDKAASLTVPEEAIVRFENKQFVFEETDKNTFTMHAVSAGNTDQGRVAIAGGEKEDLSAKKLVIRNTYALLSEMKNKTEE